MRILAVSDFVAPDLQRSPKAARFKRVDLVVSCGDLPPEFLSQLYSTLNAPVFYVKGNHDIRYGLKPPVGCTNLNARIVTFKGLRILGLEGSRWYNGGPNQYTESQMKRTIWKLRPAIWWQRGVDMVVAHAPPRFIHDAEDPCHRGFRSFRWLIDHYQPRYFLHGHLHANFSDPSERISTAGRTRVINTCGRYLFEVDHG
jgi:Icc-related predicted phosphoesterase